MTDTEKPKRKGRPKGSVNKAPKSEKKTDLDSKIKEGLDFLTDAEKKKVLSLVQSIIQKKIKNIME